MSERRSIPNYKGRQLAFSGLLLASALTGKAIDDKVDEIRANQTQPACEIKADVPGEGIGFYKQEIQEHGDNVAAERTTIVTESGHVRSGRDAHAYTGGSMTVGLGDTIRIENVDPQACIASGGRPVEEEIAGSK